MDSGTRAVNLAPPLSKKAARSTAAEDRTDASVIKGAGGEVIAAVADTSEGITTDHSRKRRHQLSNSRRLGEKQRAVEEGYGAAESKRQKAFSSQSLANGGGRPVEADKERSKLNLSKSLASTASNKPPTQHSLTSNHTSPDATTAVIATARGASGTGDGIRRVPGVWTRRGVWAPAKEPVGEDADRARAEGRRLGDRQRQRREDEVGIVRVWNILK